jgi:hypothetical protein
MAMSLERGETGLTPCKGRLYAATAVLPPGLRVLMDTIQPSCWRLKLSSSLRQESRAISRIVITPSIQSAVQGPSAARSGPLHNVNVTPSGEPGCADELFVAVDELQGAVSLSAGVLAFVAGTILLLDALDLRRSDSPG